MYGFFERTVCGVSLVYIGDCLEAIYVLLDASPWNVYAVDMNTGEVVWG